VSVGARVDPGMDDQGSGIRADVGDFLRAKLEALAAYRGQFPVAPDLLPESILLDLFGVEHFLPVQVR